MAKSECVWFKNKLTGKVDGVAKGSAAHRRMATQSVEDEEGVPQLVWEELTGDKVPKGKSEKYVPGMEATKHVVPAARERAENPPEAD
jgi:hypothetical protein